MVFLSILLGSAESAPKIKAEHTTWDLAEIDEGETLTHVFRISNGGTDKLRIDQNIIVDRPYITAVLDKYELEMDEATDLTVTFDTNGLGNRTIQAFVYLSSNDRNIAFTILAKIKPRPVPILKINPAKKYFGEVELGERKNFVFNYVNVGQGTLKIKGIIYIDKEKQFRKVRSVSHKELGPNEEGQFEIAFTAFRKGHHKSILIIESNSGGEPTLTQVELEATAITKVRGVILGSLKAPPPDEKTMKEGPDFYTLNIANSDAFEISVSYNDKGDTVLIRPRGSQTLKVPVSRGETSDKIKLVIEYSLMRRRPPAKPAVMPAPVAPGATTTVPPAKPAVSPAPAAPSDTVSPTAETSSDTR